MNTELIGLNELLRMFGDLEKLPQKCVTQAAKKGAAISLYSARANAPKKIGDLRSGIILKAEKTRTKGKKVYQVTFSNNPDFIKETLDGKRYYYPASQEYGFLKKGGGKVPGKHFMRDSVTNNATIIESTIVNEFISNMEKVT